MATVLSSCSPVVTCFCLISHAVLQVAAKVPACLWWKDVFKLLLSSEESKMFIFGKFYEIQWVKKCLKYTSIWEPKYSDLHYLLKIFEVWLLIYRSQRNRGWKYFHFSFFFLFLYDSPLQRSLILLFYFESCNLWPPWFYSFWVWLSLI